MRMQKQKYLEYDLEKKKFKITEKDATVLNHMRYGDTWDGVGIFSLFLLALTGNKFNKPFIPSIDNYE